MSEKSFGELCANAHVNDYRGTIAIRKQVVGAVWDSILGKEMSDTSSGAPIGFRIGIVCGELQNLDENIDVEILIHDVGEPDKSSGAILKVRRVEIPARELISAIQHIEMVCFNSKFLDDFPLQVGPVPVGTISEP